MISAFYYDIIDCNIIDFYELFSKEYPKLLADKEELRLTKPQFKKFMIHYMLVALMTHKMSNKIYVLYKNRCIIHAEYTELFDKCIKDIDKNLNFKFYYADNKQAFIENIGSYNNELLLVLNNKKAEKIKLKNAEKFLESNDLTYFKREIFVNYKSLLQLV